MSRWQIQTLEPTRLRGLAAAFACLPLLLAAQLVAAGPAAADEGPPVVGSVRPPSGPVSGGTTVTIKGNGFGDATEVRFGAARASFTVTANGKDNLRASQSNLPDEITAVSPSHAEGSVDVTVTTPRGTSPTVADCGDSGEASSDLGAPACDRFHYYGEPGGGAWATTGLQGKEVQEGRQYPGQATLLLSGKVLFTGYFGAELYDPATGRWSSCPEATASADCPGPIGGANHYGHTATLLRDGRVLVAGGDRVRGQGHTAHIYEPATGRWSRTADLLNPRRHHRAHLLPDGRVLVAGGVEGATQGDPRSGEPPVPGDQVEIYDPTTGQWTEVSPMKEAVRDHTAALLPSGKVLVAGGQVPFNVLFLTATDTSQLYDPVKDAWTSCPLETAATADCPGPLVTGRYNNSTTVLSDGKILAAGGVRANGVVTYSTAELYDPKRGVWTETGRMGEARYAHTAARLPNGKVLVAGGGGRYGNGRYQPVNSAELYDPASGRWRHTAFMPDATAHTGVALPSGPRAACGANCGKILVVRDGQNVPSLLFSQTPEVAGVSPNSAFASGGRAVTITGTGLASVRSVRFGGVATERVEPDALNPDGRLVAIAPAQRVAGPVEVTVTTDGGRSAAVPPARFTYFPDPSPAPTPDPGPDPGPTPGPGGGGSTAGTTSGSGQSSSPTPGAPPGAPPAIGGPPAGGQVGPPAPSAPTPPAAGERSALRACLAQARRKSTRARRRAAQRRCQRPGRVSRLRARARSSSEVVLTFGAPGSVAGSGPPVGRFVVKQSRRPIRSERGFRRARTLCGGKSCRFGPTRVGQRISLTVTDLRPRTRYFYAVKAVGSSGRAGPRSKTARVRTR